MYNFSEFSAYIHCIQLSFALPWSTLSMGLWQSPRITEWEARQPTRATRDINLWVWQKGHVSTVDIIVTRHQSVKVRENCPRSLPVLWSPRRFMCNYYQLQLSFALTWTILSMGLWKSLITESVARQPTRVTRHTNLWVWLKGRVSTVEYIVTMHQSANVRKFSLTVLNTYYDVYPLQLSFALP
jgi:hypothetical protein